MHRVYVLRAVCHNRISSLSDMIDVQLYLSPQTGIIQVVSVKEVSSVGGKQRGEKKRKRKNTINSKEFILFKKQQDREKWFFKEEPFISQCRLRR